MTLSAADPTPPSIRKRFLVSVGANAGRAALSLAVGLVVARGLGPADYGNIAYLLGSFWAIRALLNLGASSAFYTFIAQRHRARGYYTVYFAWLAFQFLFSVALVALVLPDSQIERFWLGQDRPIVLLALLATFLQNQVWQTVMQMHEAIRQTVRVQVAGLWIVSVHLTVVAVLLAGSWLSVAAVLWAIVAEYLIATAWLAVSLRRILAQQVPEAGKGALRPICWEYVRYCRPLVVVAVFSFFYEIADRWLLQRYGGASQQGFFQVASQLSTVSLLAVTSILNILWKEIAEACARGEDLRVAALYRKASRFLVTLAAIVSCFLVPWAEELVELLLGAAYGAAWPILVMMLFYPIYQAVGQINGTLFMATGQNDIYMRLSIAGMLTSIPVSYLMIAPPGAAVVSGFGMGALGLAIKYLGLNLVFTNIQSWTIARRYGFRYGWEHQICVILVCLALSSACRIGVGVLMPFLTENLRIPDWGAVPVAMVGAGVLYSIGIVAVILRWPNLAGLERSEIARVVERLKSVARPTRGR